MNLSETAIGAAAPMLCVLIVVLMLGLAAWGWWLGVTSGRDKRR